MICHHPIDLKRKRSNSGGDHSEEGISGEVETPAPKKVKHDDDNDAPKPSSSDVEPG